MPRHDEDEPELSQAPIGARILSVVAPAAEHLVNALGEIAAAGQAVIDAVPERTRRRYSRTLAVGGTALGILGSVARSAAETARSRSRARVKKEALNEIASALEAHAARVPEPAAKALRAVRDVLSEKKPAPALPKKGTAARTTKPNPMRSGSKRSPSRAAARKVSRRKATLDAIAREVQKTQVEE